MNIGTLPVWLQTYHSTQFSPGQRRSWPFVHSSICESLMVRKARTFKEISALWITNDNVLDAMDKRLFAEPERISSPTNQRTLGKERQFFQDRWCYSNPWESSGKSMEIGSCESKGDFCLRMREKVKKVFLFHHFRSCIAWTRGFRCCGIWQPNLWRRIIL